MPRAGSSGIAVAPLVFSTEKRLRRGHAARQSLHHHYLLSLGLDANWAVEQIDLSLEEKRSVERRSVEKVRHVGLDEKSFGRGQSYVWLLVGLDESRGLEVVPERTTESAKTGLAESVTKTREPERALGTKRANRECSKAKPAGVRSGRMLATATAWRKLPGTVSG